MLVELLLVLVILTSSYQINVFKPILFLDETLSKFILNDQIAMVRLHNMDNHKKVCLTTIHKQLNDVCFNNEGHVNRAQTVHINGYAIVFNLGFGHHYIKQIKS